MTVDREHLAAWAPDLALAGAVFVLGLTEAARTGPIEADWVDLALVAFGMATAVGLSRRLPGAALGIVWLVCLLQLSTGTPILVVQLAITIVAFGATRWGSTPTVVLSGLSIPAAAVIAVLFVGSRVYDVIAGVVDYNSVINSSYRFGASWQIGAAVLVILVLGVPWLAGLAVRLGTRARESRVSQVAAEQDAARAVRESEQAREIARLREDQARLARDVHDVVGHSLAVILAQAESAQYTEDGDTARLKETMATIATSARTSLQDVRQVLTTTKGTTVVGRDGGLDTLVDGVRSSGHDVTSSEVGTPQPLPPELEVVAYRVLQEMLTNAITHGRRDTPIAVERHWEGELRLEVRNLVQGHGEGSSADVTRPIRTQHTGDPDREGQGIEGMRRRLEAVGGRLDVRRREEPGGQTFTATAWVPVRGGS